MADTEKDKGSRPEVFLGKGVWKCAAKLQENNHAQVQFQ